MHALIDIVDAPKLDENGDSKVIEFIEENITCALPKVWTNHHTATCRKKNGVTCKFNFPQATTDKTRIVHSEEIYETIVKQSRKLIDKLVSYIVTVSDLSDVTL